MISDHSLTSSNIPSLLNLLILIYLLSFVLKINFYGPVSKQGIIRKAISNIFNDKELITQQQIITVETDPVTANVNDSFGYLENFEDF